MVMQNKALVLMSSQYANNMHAKKCYFLSELHFLSEYF